MLLTDLCSLFSEAIITRRITKDEVSTPKAIRFLTGGCNLDPELLYLTDAQSAEQHLPVCTAPGGSVVFCSGPVPRSLSFQVSINLICVELPLPELYNLLSSHLLTLQQNADKEEEALRRKFSDIVDKKYSSSYQVDSLCATFPHPFKSSYCVICIESQEAPGQAVPDLSMQKALRVLFPEDNVTTYDNSTVVIHTYNGFTHPPKLPMEELSELLKKYNACAGISNGMRKQSQLRVMYILARRAMEAGKILRTEDKNVFLYDETMLFSIVSLAASSFKEQFDNDDIILLGSPILANILKHDPKGKRGLADTMFQYIANGGSTTKTAEAMHMHRNTVKNRIAVIEKIAGEPLYVNGIMSAKLLTTYYIMQYYTKVWNKNLVLSPLKKDCDNVVSINQP